MANWSGTLPDGTVWGATPGEVEVVTGNVDVPAGSTLTIRAGAIVKFQATRQLNVAGTVTTEGTAAEPIHLTSFADDTVGGDTNGNGGATSPTAGDWDGVRLTAATANVQLDHVVVRYAGFSRPSIQVDGGSFALDQSSITDSRRNALQFNSGATGTYNLEDLTIVNANVGQFFGGIGLFVNSNLAVTNATNLSIQDVRGSGALHVVANNAGNWSSTGTSLTGAGVKAITFEGGTITDTRA